MNRIRTFAIAMVMTIALGAMGQQTSTTPSLDDHMKFLSTQLDLTADQQAKIRPIVKEMQESAEKVRQDETLSMEQRHEKLKAVHMKAIKQADQYLSAEQQQKLDALQNQPHPDAHDNAH